jgi:hypothetical protein
MRRFPADWLLPPKPQPPNGPVVLCDCPKSGDERLPTGAQRFVRLKMLVMLAVNVRL